MNNTITSGDAHNDSALASPDAPSLEKALEKSEDVKEKMVDCVAELSIVNEAVKQEMAAGILTREGRKALAQSESVEEKVQECADELHEVNQVLAEGISGQNEINRELRKMGRKLAATQHMLSHAQDVLAVAEEAAEQAVQRTFRDFVTGIPNRELFNDRLEQAIALAQRNGWILAVMFIDLDRFKAINDTHGHAVGDKVLQAVAQRLSEQIRSGDTICRWGGDEFLYLLVNPQSRDNIERISRKVLDAVSKFLTIDHLALSIEPSIGIAVYPTDGNTAEELLANADAAMYRAKKTKTGYVFFDDVAGKGTGKP
jgi:diguanylate cyclase (GGDEF)-like protein